MPTSETQTTYANTNNKVGLAGKAGGPAEVSDPDSGRYEAQVALGDVTPATALSALATGEVQTVSLTGDNATSGTFTLTFSGQTTAAIAWNATADAVEDALQALSNVGPGEVQVSKSGVDGEQVYTAKFLGSFFGTNVAQMTSTESLEPAGATITHATTTAGANP